MGTVFLVISVFVLYILAYQTYGRYLARCIFQLDPQRTTPALEINDGIEISLSHKLLVFGIASHCSPAQAPSSALLSPLYGVVVLSMYHGGRIITDLTGDVFIASVLPNEGLFQP